MNRDFALLNSAEWEKIGIEWVGIVRFVPGGGAYTSVNIPIFEFFT